MVKTLRVLLSLLLALTMLGGTLSAMAETAATETTTSADTPLVVAFEQFSQKFSPFFADTGMDNDASDMVQLRLLTYDRMGEVVNNAIEGETRKLGDNEYTYNGPADIFVNYDEAADKTVYTIKLREDLVFSDGVPLTADDVIFNYYVYCDPSYTGSATINSYNIVGLQNYRTQTSEDIYAKYQDIAAAIAEAGPDHVWAEGDAFTKEQ